MKRVKSSLGKRSSSIGSFSSRNSDINASNRTSVNKRKSCILQPGFLTKNTRSGSVDTLNDGHTSMASSRDSRLMTSSSVKKPMQRSRSQSNLMTPRTPGNNVSFMPQHNLPMGSVKSARSRTSTDPNNRDRMSSVGSIGGTRISKKDNRPINDKAFIQEMTEKVQKFALQFSDCKSLMNNNKIRPMTTQLFIVLCEVALQHFDPQLVLNSSNYATEIPSLAKLFMYKGKIDRTMLITVSTPHAYPNVIAFLGWFVECQEIAKSLNIELLFDQFERSNNFGNQDDEDEDDYYFDFPILIPHIAQCYSYFNKNKNYAVLDVAFHEKLRERSAVDTEGSMKTLQELEEFEEKYSKFEEENSVEIQELQMLEETLSILKTDIQEQEQYLLQSDEYITSVSCQEERVLQELEKSDRNIEEVSKKIQMLNLAVQNQKLSREDKEKLAHERSEIVGEINLLDAQTKSFNEILYAEQIDYAKVRNKVNASILEYNNELYNNLNTIPNAEELKIGSNIIINEEIAEEHQKVDELLNNMLKSMETKAELLEANITNVRTNTEKQDGISKPMNDQLTAISEANIIFETELMNMKEPFETEIRRMECEIKIVENEIEDCKMKKPNVQNLQKKLNQLKEEMNQVKLLVKQNSDQMKRRILHADNEYRRMYEAAQAVIKDVSVKKNMFENMLKATVVTDATKAPAETNSENFAKAPVETNATTN